MSVEQNLHFEGASALLGQLTEHLREQESKILQVYITRHLLHTKTILVQMYQQAKALLKCFASYATD